MTTPVPTAFVPAGRELRLRIGTVESSAHPLLQRLALPLIPDFVDATAYAMDALEQAVASRQGVVLIGPGDCGKSTAMTQAIRAFEDAEARVSKESSDYEDRRIVHVHGLRADKELDVIVALYVAAFETAPILKTAGRRKTVDEVLRELTTRLRDERVAALVLDDAQDIAAPALHLIERLMAHAVDREAGRLGAATATAADGTVAPAGVGVVLVGTARLEHAIRYGEEAGNAWKTIQHVHALPAESVPDALCRLLPAWAAGAAALGATAWADFVATHITLGRPVPIGSLDMMARLYVRRLATAALDEGVTWTSLAEVPWDRDMLCYVRQEVLVPHGGVLPGHRAAA